jgi:ElaB/YqjD/DUF883 family membrane-anchored ribosome-binding protein
MDKESDVIKHQMEHTRAALTDKLELLEHQVSDTVTGAAETVEKVRQTVQDTVSGAAETVASMQHCIQDTVQSVRESVRETAETVSETLDVRKQVEKHPWAMMAGATAVGFGVGILVTRVDVPAAAASMVSSKASNGNGAAGNNGGWSEPPPSVFQQIKRGDGNGRAQRQQTSEEPAWAPAVNQLKGLAIGAMFGVLREILAKSMPDALSGQVGEVINGFTTSLGGKPITGKILPDSWSGSEDRRADSQESEGIRETSGQAGQMGFPRPRQTAMADIEE